MIACEDTRRTLKLLTHFEISKRLVSYHEHNELMRAPEIVIDLEQGAKVALVTDAGTARNFRSRPFAWSLYCLDHLNRGHGHSRRIRVRRRSFGFRITNGGIRISRDFCTSRPTERRKALRKLKRSPERSRCMRRPIVCSIPWKMLSKSSATGPP